MRSIGVLQALLVVAVVLFAATVQAQTQDIWANKAVTTSAQVTTGTLVQPLDVIGPVATRDVGVYVTLNKGTATSVLLAPAIPDGAGGTFPASAAQATITGNTFVSFAGSNWEPGQQVFLAVTGVGDVTTTAPALAIKAKLR